MRDAAEEGKDELGEAYHDALDKAEEVGEIIEEHAEEVRKEIEEAVND